MPYHSQEQLSELPDLELFHISMVAPRVCTEYWGSILQALTNMELGRMCPCARDLNLPVYSVVMFAQAWQTKICALVLLMKKYHLFRHHRQQHYYGIAHASVTYN